jgi:tRNA G18 (ribose-2'-O)-methylase SpoU
MPRQVTAFSNATVKLLRSLRDKKARKSEGLFLAEGLRILTEARDSGRLPEIVAFSAEGAKHPLAAEIIAAAEAAGGDAVGAGGLILVDDCADPFSVEAVRASMGAIFTQQVATCRWPEFVEWLRGGAGQLVGTSLKATLDYLEAEYRKPCFLLIGNEQQGLPAEYEAECDLLVKIPMAGRADSLNAAMATAVMAFAVKASWR